MNEKQPFYQGDYQKKDEEFYPVLKVVCRFKKTNIPFTALADTGCDSGIVLLKNELEILKKQFKELDLGERRNEDPLPVGVADGHIVGADLYFVTIELNGDTKEVALFLVDSDRILGHEREEKRTIEDIFPLVGRDFLNHFDVFFKGKEKRISVFTE